MYHCFFLFARVKVELNLNTYSEMLEDELDDDDDDDAMEETQSKVNDT